MPPQRGWEGEERSPPRDSGRHNRAEYGTSCQPWTAMRSTSPRRCGTVPFRSGRCRSTGRRAPGRIGAPGRRLPTGGLAVPVHDDEVELRLGGRPLQQTLEGPLPGLSRTAPQQDGTPPSSSGRARCVRGAPVDGERAVSVHRGGGDQVVHDRVGAALEAGKRGLVADLVVVAGHARGESRRTCGRPRRGDRDVLPRIPRGVAPNGSPPFARRARRRCGPGRGRRRLASARAESTGSVRSSSRSASGCPRSRPLRPDLSGSEALRGIRRPPLRWHRTCHVGIITLEHPEAIPQDQKQRANKVATGQKTQQAVSISTATRRGKPPRTARIHNWLHPC